MSTNRESEPLRRYSIEALDHGIYNSLIVAVIIGKQSTREFDGRNGDMSDVARAVWNFTIRDSVTDFMNVTVWGSRSYVVELCNMFKVGDVVEIQKARIELRQSEDIGEQFRPTVTSPFRLTINENVGNIIEYIGTDKPRYEQLTHFTTKPVVQTVSLADVHNNINTWKGDHVDLLVVIQQLGTVRTVTTRDNIEKMVREVMVFDETLTNFLITLWDADYISRSNKWIPRETLLYMADVKILYNDFKKTPTISLAPRTILIVDPCGYGAERLLQYAKFAVIEDSTLLSGLSNSTIDLNSIKTVMNCHQILKKINKIMGSDVVATDEETFTVLTYSLVTQFDIDGYSIITHSKCAKCKSYIPRYNLKCQNEECVTTDGEIETIFSIKMNIADHSGSLEDCVLSGRYAEQVLQYKVHEFLQLNINDKTNIKWRYLLNHCALKLIIMCRSGRKPHISVLTCELADIDELSEKLPQ